MFRLGTECSENVFSFVPLFYVSFILGICMFGKKKFFYGFIVGSFISGSRLVILLENLVGFFFTTLAEFENLEEI